MFRRALSSRFARIAFRVVAWAAIFLVCGYALLHAATRYAVRTVAARLGLTEFSFDVRTVSFSRVVLGDVHVGPGEAPKVGSVEVGFSAWELISGKVRSVHVVGAEATVDLTTQTPRIVGLPFNAPSPTTGPAQPVVLLPKDLPDIVDVESSIVHLKLAAGDVRLPVSAKFVNGGSVGPRATGTLSLGADQLAFSATGTSAGAWTAQADGKVSVAALLPALPAGTLPPGAIVDARLNVNASYDLSTNTGTVEASLDGGTARADLSGNSMSVTDASADVKVNVARGEVSASSTFSGNIRLPWLDGRTRLAVDARFDGTDLAGTLSATGPSLSMTVPDVSYRHRTLSADARIAVTPSTWMLALAEKAGVSFRSSSPLLASAHVQRDQDGTVVARVTDISAATTDLHVAAGVDVPESSLSVAEVSISGVPGKDWDFAASGISALAKGPRELPANAAASAGSMVGRISANGEVAFDAPDVQASIDPTDVTLGPAQVSGLAAQLHLHASGSADQVAVMLKDGSTASLQSLREGASQVELGALTFALTQRTRPTTGPGAATQPSTQPDPPLLLIRKGMPAQIAFNSQTTAPIGVRSANANASVGHVIGNLQLTLGQQVGVDGYVRLEHSDIDLPAIDAKVRGVTLSLPLNLDALTPREGAITMDAIERDGRRLPAMDGHLWVTRRGAYAGFDWPLVSEGLVKGEVRADFLPGGTTSIDAHMWIPEFSFSKSEDVRKLLPPGLADLDVTGRFSAELRYSIVNGHTTRWGEIEVKDASMRSRKLGDTNLTGVNGHVWTRNFSPLETAPNQTLSVKSARLGDLAVNDGNVRFRIDPGDIIFIEDATFDYAGGKLSGRGFRLAPLQSATDLVLYADHLDLGAFAKLASGGRVDATGSLFARLPVSLNWDKRTLSLGTGYLYADARPGALSLGATEPQVARLFNLGPETDNFAVKRLTSALTNFKYSALSLDLYRTPNDRLDGVARVAGRGDRGTSGQAVDLTLNLHGLDNGLEDLLQLFLFK